MENNFRTDEQFESIRDNMLYGNWSDAADTYIKGGWSITGFYERMDQYRGMEYPVLISDRDAAILVEVVWQKKMKEND